MKKTKSIAAVVTLAVVTLVVALLRPTATPYETVLRLGGTPGLPVTGRLVVDEASSAFTASVPTNFTLRGRSILYRIKKTTAPGKLTATFEIKGTGSLSSGTTNAFAGVSGGAGYSGRLWPRPVRFTTDLLKEELP